ncbi:MAG: hypothetical protein NTV94_02400 [Planctomycetota bacterium]|nr:hypothetical protein [Planctomycetota bacterium]
MSQCFLHLCEEPLPAMAFEIRCELVVFGIRDHNTEDAAFAAGMKLVYLDAANVGPTYSDGGFERADHGGDGARFGTDLHAKVAEPVERCPVQAKQSAKKSDRDDQDAHEDVQRACGPSAWYLWVAGDAVEQLHPEPWKLHKYFGETKQEEK